MGEHDLSWDRIHHQSHRTLPETVLYGGEVAESREKVDGRSIPGAECWSYWSRGADAGDVVVVFHISLRCLFSSLTWLALFSTFLISTPALLCFGVQLQSRAKGVRHSSKNNKLSSVVSPHLFTSIYSPFSLFQCWVTNRLTSCDNVLRPTQHCDVGEGWKNTELCEPSSPSPQKRLFSLSVFRLMQYSSLHFCRSKNTTGSCTRSSRCLMQRKRS